MQNATPRPKNKPPTRRPFAEYRLRDVLTKDEIKDMWLSQKSKNEDQYFRNAVLVRTAYRHALACGHIVNLRWTDLDLKRCTITIRPLPGRGGVETTHKLTKSEVKDFMRLREKFGFGQFVFKPRASTRGERQTSVQMSRSLVGHIIHMSAKEAQVEIPVAPDMLRTTRAAHLFQGGMSPQTLQAFLGLSQFHSVLRYLEFAQKHTPDPVMEVPKDCLE